MSWIPKKKNELKIVLVGDSGVGKTQLLWKYVPTFFCVCVLARKRQNDVPNDNQRLGTETVRLLPIIRYHL